MSNESQNNTLRAITILITTLLTLFLTIYFLWPAFKILENQQHTEPPKENIQK